MPKLSEEQFLSRFSGYEKPLPHGLRLPQIQIEEKYYKMLGEHSSISNFDFLRKLCWKGVKDRGIDKLPNAKEYYDRLKHELDTFNELGFVDYVLLNWDILNFCYESKIPIGRSRGSSAGSVVLYCIKVTDLDPIVNGLFFERFVSKARARKFDVDGITYLDGSLSPDVDHDVGYYERQSVLAYINSKYVGKTSQILTMNTLSSKLCVKECGKIVSELPESDMTVVSNYIPKIFGRVKSISDTETESPEFSQWAGQNMEALRIAKRIEGLIKNFGVHPSGIAIAHDEITSLMPLQKTKEGENVTGYDMNWVAEYAVKFDILGLRTLSVVRECCNILGIKERDIDYNDPFIYEVLQDLKYPVGLFQIEADCNYRVCRDVQPLSLTELSDVLSLARPGAVSFVSNYADVKNGRKEIEKRHPELDEILSKSKGIFLYQESLMQVCHRVFGLSLEDAESIRRGVGKKKLEEVVKWKPKIYQKAEELDIDSSVTDYYWDALQDAADYSFNKCIWEEEKVDLELGGRKKLKEVQVGDRIRGFNTKTEKDEPVIVRNVFRNEKEVYSVAFPNGESITCSMDHKFLCCGVDGFSMQQLRDVIKHNLVVVTRSLDKLLPQKILGFTKVGVKKTIDLEINSEDHNFYCNGVVVSNSHSVSYATLSAATVYLKFKHPREFFVSLLRMAKFEPDSHAEAHKICRELPYFNIKLLPPDLERSDIDFTIEGENIRYGLGMIKGVSDKSIIALKEFRDSEKPNKYDIFLCAKEAGINIGLLSALIQAGALPNYKQKRSRLVLEAQAFNLLTDREKRNIVALGPQYDYDLLRCIKECVDNSVVGDDQKPLFKPSRFETFSKKYEKYKEIYNQNSKFEMFANWYFENKLLGYAVTTQLVDVFDDTFDNSRRFNEMPVKEFGKFICIVEDVISGKSKNGNKYIKLFLKDEMGDFMAMLVDSEREPKCSNFLESAKRKPEKGDVVVVRGRKGNDILFVDEMDVMTAKIYMKLSELKD